MTAAARFYVWEGPAPGAPAGPARAADRAGLRVEAWRPSAARAFPRGVRSPSALAWWLFHQLGVFASREYGFLCIYQDGRLVHRSLVTPRWFRFPAMGPRDLQIGATWTDPACRGRGLARLAVAEILRLWSGRFERMWYVVSPDNPASVRVIEACGFALAGTGARTRPFGLAPLGAYRLERPAGTGEGRSPAPPPGGEAPARGGA